MGNGNRIMENETIGPECVLNENETRIFGFLQNKSGKWNNVFEDRRS